MLKKSIFIRNLHYTIFHMETNVLQDFRICITPHKKCPYLEFFWSVFSQIRTEYGEIRSISPFSVRMRENTDQKNSEYGHFLRSINVFLIKFLGKCF